MVMRLLERMPGSPAPAGIDRTRSRYQRRRDGFPRTRGDRPFTLIFGIELALVPPHPRG